MENETKWLPYFRSICMFLAFTYIMVIVYCYTQSDLLFSIIMNLVTYQMHFCKINYVLCNVVDIVNGRLHFVTRLKLNQFAEQKFDPSTYLDQSLA